MGVPAISQTAAIMLAGGTATVILLS